MTSNDRDQTLAEKTYPDMVRDSGLVEPARWESYLAGLGEARPQSGPQWAERLVADAILTPFQAKVILQGRYRDFILKKKYKILSLLGVGGMGRVFLCEHMTMKRLVAIKVMPRDRNDEPGAIERFFREARLAASLRHPHIVHVYDLEPDVKMPMLIMEYIDGVDLQTLVKRSGPIDPIRAATFISQAALGLQHAADAGLVHRDIKPSNLLVDRQGMVKILDLGLARLMGNAGDVTRKFDDNAVLGTADYIAPEQALNQPIDVRADIYALGGTFYYLLAGIPPFGDGPIAKKLIAHQTTPPPHITTVRSDVPAAMDAVIRRMLAKSPQDRYTQPREVYDALQQWVTGTVEAPGTGDLNTVTEVLSEREHPTGTGRTTSMMLPISRAFRPSRRTVIGLSAGLLIASAIIILLMHRDSDTLMTRQEKGTPTLGMLALTPEQARQHIGQKRTIEFVVRRAGYNAPKNDKLFLNSLAQFSDPDCFTVVIPQAVGEGFGEPFPQLGKSLEGQRVGVTGTIVLYNGRAEIILEEASQLSRLTPGSGSP